MPSLPIYESRQNLQPQVAAPLRDEASQDFENQQKINTTLQGIRQQWSQANDVMQYTEATAKFGAKLYDIESRAYSDPDFRDPERYFEEISKAKEESLSVVKNQRNAALLGYKFDQDGLATKLKISNDFNDKKEIYNKQMLQDNLSILFEKSLTAMSEAESLNYRKEAEFLVNQNLSNYTISRDEAEKYVTDARTKAVEGMVYSAPDVAIQKLNQNDYGLDAKSKNKYIEEANSVIKKNIEIAQWRINQTQTKATIELSDALSAGTLTPVMVRDMQQKGLIDSETAAIFDSIALKKTYEIPESTSLAQPDYFLRLIEDSMGRKDKIQKVMADAAKAYGDHKLGTNQYLYFIQSAKETFDRQSKGIFTTSRGQNKFVAAMDGIKAFFKNLGESKKEDFNSAVASFTDRIKPGEDPHVVKDQVINEHRVKIKPAIENFPENGKLMVDKNGNKALVYPDGRIEEVK